jgi:hypothetical protein
MKTIIVNNVSYEFDVADEIRVKDARKMDKLNKIHGEEDQMDMVIEMIKSFSTDSKIEEVVGDLNMSDFTELVEKFSAIIADLTKKQEETGKK